jgi:fructose-1,6-bisphosphatase/sedoheptulose 1,7-bisphosphatase-like protein
MANRSELIDLYLPDRNDDIDIDTSLAENFRAIDAAFGEVLQRGTINISYDDDGRVTTITSQGATIGLEYDGDEVISIIQSVGNRIIEYSVNYDDDGNIQSIVREER